MGLGIIEKIENRERRLIKFFTGYGSGKDSRRHIENLPAFRFHRFIVTPLFGIGELRYREGVFVVPRFKEELVEKYFIFTDRQAGNILILL